MSETQAREIAHHSRRAQAARMVDKLGINWDELPKLPFWSFRKQIYRLSIADTVINGQQLIQRQFTPAERDAVAYYTAKKLVTLSYAPPISLTAAYFAQKRGRATFRFPFWTPKPTSFDPSRFPIPSQKVPFYIFDGPLAIGAWHAMRGVSYYIAINFAVKLFLNVYSTSVEVAGMSRDPRLQDMAKDLKERGPRSRGRVPPLEDPSIRDADSPYGNTQYGDYSTNQSAESTGADYDSSRETGSDNAETTDSYIPPQPQAQSQQKPRQRPTPTESYVPPPSEGFESGGLFDDASPVAPAARGQPTSTSGSSSWDQIRRRAAQTGAGVSESRPQQSSRSQDMDTTGASQADRDREQAQREFDLLLERERQTESGDRWSRRS